MVEQKQNPMQFLMGFALLAFVLCDCIGYVAPECEFDTQCPGSSMCVGGKCTDGLCPLVPCPKGQNCINGICCLPSEKTETTCSDNQDNDCDESVDCADSDCEGKSCDDQNQDTVNDICKEGVCQGQSTKCQPGASLPCGRCQSGKQICQEDQTWGTCQDETGCVPQTKQTCGSNGMQTCRDDCAWGDCLEPGECTPPVEKPCGDRCGKQICQPDGRFGVECEGEGECQPGKWEPCGSKCGQHQCGTDCHWEANCQNEGLCSPGTAGAACGNCGHVTCNDSCAWGTACDGQGVCVPGTPGAACGNCGHVTCNNSCAWGTACDGQGVCAPGTAGAACGNCGHVTCTNSCAWGTACDDQGVCVPGTPGAACGNCGHVTCNDSCAWGTACDGQGVCAPGTAGAACGNCGHVTCTNSCAWGTNCDGQGTCSPGQMQVCANCAGVQTCGSGCAWGACGPLGAAASSWRGICGDNSCAFGRNCPLAIGDPLCAVVTFADVAGPPASVQVTTGAYFDFAAVTPVAENMHLNLNGCSRITVSIMSRNHCSMYYNSGYGWQGAVPIIVLGSASGIISYAPSNPEILLPLDETAGYVNIEVPLAGSINWIRNISGGTLSDVEYVEIHTDTYGPDPGWETQYYFWISNLMLRP